MITKGKTKYDLEDRSFAFAHQVRKFVKLLPKTTSNYEDVKQVVRSSGSIGANYIEANESLSKKDLIHRMKISKKEAKETRYWLRLVDAQGSVLLEEKRDRLIQEATEIMNIMGAIIKNIEGKN